MAAPDRPRLSTRRKLAFLAALLALALVGLELGARAVTSPPRPIYYAHPYLRKVRAPEVPLELISPLDGRKYTAHIDVHGFRGGSLEPPGAPKPPDTYRIFFVGGSTTENGPLPDEDAWPQLVEVELQKKLGATPRLRCVNTAIAGNLAADSFALIAHRILTLEPDLIVCLEGINDLCMGMGRRFDPTVANYTAPPRPGFADLLTARSRLAQLIQHAASRAETAWEGNASLARRRKSEHTPGLDPLKGLPRFERYLRMIAAVCREADVPLLLMTMPTLFKESMSPAELDVLWMGYMDRGKVNADPPTMLRGMRAFNDTVRQVAREEGTLFLDLEADVPKDLEHLYDDCHYTVKGSRLVAERVTAFLAGRGLP